MSELHIKGYLCRDIDGFISIADNNNDIYNHSTCISIISMVEEFAKEYGIFGSYRKGLGGRKSYIDNVNLRIYFTDKKCDIDEAMLSLLYELEGDLKTDVALVGYSEYTITGCCIEDFSIGGHNIENELSEHIGKYINFVLECV